MFTTGIQGSQNKKSPRSDGKAFVVVEVWRGFAVGAQCFKSEKKAKAYLKRLTATYDEHNDDVQIFEVDIAE